jgi:predicted Zn finger-like uncharacterized protein
MSMITGCPACGTMFKVVPDQLKISEGWVRCGHCSEVFDAAAHLQAAAPAGAAQAASQAQPPSTPQAQSPAADAAGEPQEPLQLQWLLQREDVPSTFPADAASQAERGAADLAPQAPFEQDEVPDSGWERAPAAASPHASGPPSAVTARAPDAAASDSGYPPMDFLREEMDSQLPPHERASTWRREESDEDDAPLEDLGFLRQARRQAFWRRPAVRLLLAAVALLLAALLGGQWLLHERDRLAAAQPQWRPWLVQLCAALGCSIGPPRRIDALMIDSSGFVRLRGSDAYRLSFTVRNQASQPVALPALELTLTDAQDQPVVRRVLSPRELGAPAETLAANGDWSGSVALAVNANGSSGRISGYRLLAFYP